MGGGARRIQRCAACTLAPPRRARPGGAAAPCMQRACGLGRPPHHASFTDSSVHDRQASWTGCVEGAGAPATEHGGGRGHQTMGGGPLRIPSLRKRPAPAALLSLALRVKCYICRCSNQMQLAGWKEELQGRQAGAQLRRVDWCRAGRGSCSQLRWDPSDARVRLVRRNERCEDGG